MSDSLSGIETRVQQIEAALAVIEQRLERLDVQAPAGAPPVAEASHAPRDLDGLSAAGSRWPDASTIVGLIGRTLFVLAGAFLLRALTESGRLGAGPGLILGLAFAGVWVGAALRAGRIGQHVSAGFHGLAFVLIAFPLLFEATASFRFLTSSSATLGLCAITAVALAVGWRARLQSLVWLASAGGVMAAVSLALSAAETGPFALFLVVLGVALLWFGYIFEWTLLRWPAALVANAAVFVVSVRAVTPGSADAPGVAYAAQMLLLVAYLGSFAARTLLLNRDVILFEVVQSVGATLVGLGGAAVLTHISPTRGGELPLGIATLALAAGCYGAAAVFVERQQSRRWNYYFYTSAGLVFALAGAALSLPTGAVGAAYAVFGVIGAWLGRVSDRSTYRAHGAVYLMAAASVAGVLPYAAYGLGLPIAPARPPSGLVVAILALCAAALWGLRAGAPSAVRRVPRLIVLLLVLGGLFGCTVSWLLTPDGGRWSAAPDVIATARTALLVAGILALALVDRSWGVPEAAWLVYPLLGATGLKFLLEDVRVGRPATLVAGFALYGLALIVAPRLRWRPKG